MKIPLRQYSQLLARYLRPLWRQVVLLACLIFVSISLQLINPQIVAGFSIEFRDNVSADEIEACVERIEAKLKTEAPEIVAVFVKPQTSATWQTRRERIIAQG